MNQHFTRQTPAKRRAFFDATPLLRQPNAWFYGETRHNRDLAGIIVRDENLDLKFVIYDNEAVAYRLPDAEEASQLNSLIGPAGPRLLQLENAIPPEQLFRNEDILVCSGPGWEYLDYRYLASLASTQGMRITTFLHDMPQVAQGTMTSEKSDTRSRHFIEMGHVSRQIITFSKHCTKLYRTLKATPNGLSVDIDWLHLPPTLEERTAASAELPVYGLEESQMALCCGPISNSGNHMLLLQAWDWLRDRLPEEKLPVLVLAGPWADDSDLIKHTLNRNWRLNQKVRVIEEASDAELIWLHRRALLSLYPSQIDGDGKFLSESLSFGTPTIISDTPALQEISAGRAISIPPQDFATWTATLLSLLMNNQKIGNMRRQHRKAQALQEQTMWDLRRIITSPEPIAA